MNEIDLMRAAMLNPLTCEDMGMMPDDPVLDFWRVAFEGVRKSARREFAKQIETHIKEELDGEHNDHVIIAMNLLAQYIEGVA